MVAPGFSGGDLLGFAKTSAVSLLTADDLCSVVKLHDENPFSLLDLEDLFRYHGTPDMPLKQLKRLHDHRTKTDELPGVLISRIQALYDLGIVEPVTADSLFHNLLSHFNEVRYKKEDIEAALVLLSSPLVKALEKTTVGYSLVMPLETLSRKFASLGKRCRGQGTAIVPISGSGKVSK
ncbi:MAG: hypothetical protein FJZ01_27360 [Candidatus Sericytochromatia bacterium]|nr:hypothetical protein [Candidatus Tanganyikabacteria bacterium]